MCKVKNRIQIFFGVFFLIFVILSPAFALADEPIKEVCYHPRNYDWGRFWLDYRSGVRDQFIADLPLIKSMNANTVRLIIQPRFTGYPYPTAQFLADLRDALFLLSQYGLKAQVTLFDFDDFYPHTCDEAGEPNFLKIQTVINDSKTWLSEFFNNLDATDKSRIVLWELTNELTLYHPTTGQRIERAHQWLKGVFPHLKSLAGTTPCTVSVSSVEWLNDLKALSSPPDIYNLHWYPDWRVWTQPLSKILERAYEIIGVDERLMIGEFGLNTYQIWDPIQPSSDVSQYDAYRDILYYAYQKGVVDLAAWTFNDLPSGRKKYALIYDFVGTPCPTYKGQHFESLDLPPGELHYGIYKINGGNNLVAKPAATVLQEAFRGNYPLSPTSPSILNASFESLNPYSGSGRLENWQPWNEDFSLTPFYAQDCTQKRTGSCSVKITPPPTSAGKDPFIAGLSGIPTLKVIPARNYIFKGYALTSPSGLARLGLTWLKEDGSYLGDELSNPLVNAINWTELQIQGVVPNEAAFVIISAKSIDMNKGSAPSWFDDLSFIIENRPPVLNPIGNKFIKESSALTFTISATDADNDPLMYSANALPRGASFNPSTHTFSWTPDFDQVGNYTLTFAVSDDFLNDSETITIGVGNLPLQITSLSASPNPFSPNGDGRDDNTTISGRFNHGVISWLLGIRNSTGSIVRLFSGTSAPVNQVWNGKDDRGSRLPNGIYTYTLSGRDIGSSVAEKSGQVIINNPATPPPPSTCFLKGTPILMANGKTKAIEKVKAGDRVMAYDEITKQLKVDKVKKAFRHKADKYLIINGRLKATDNHLVYSVGKWIEVGKLKIGDSLLNSQGKLESITSIQLVSKRAKVYNLEVNPYHIYIADGIVVHNKVAPSN